MHPQDLEAVGAENELAAERSATSTVVTRGQIGKAQF
jgi:hypothetical protein